MIRVVIADDHPVVRWGLKQMLATDLGLIVVGEVADGQALLDEVDRMQPDVVLLDIRMPHLDGMHAVRGLRKRHPHVRVLIVTVFDDADHIHEALAEGVSGYLLKTAGRDTLVNAIRAVHTGRRVVDPELVHLVLDRFAEVVQGLDRRRPALSSEELRLLRLLSVGATAATIAGELHWSPTTVGRRISQVCEKLGARNRAQAVREATRLQLV